NKSTDKTAIRLFSFELKKQVDRINYREYFFQAVSNSSWAHEGYLVTCAVQQQDDLLSELERLSASFGIGIIVWIWMILIRLLFCIQQNLKITLIGNP